MATGDRPLLRSLAAVFLAAAGLCGVGIIVEAVELSRQTTIQRGIDAHTVQVSGRYADRITDRGVFQDDVSVLTYYFGGAFIRAELRSLPRDPGIGEYICLEIDARQPDHARVCGTRGGLDNARRGLMTGSALLAGSLAIGGLLVWRGRRGGPLELDWVDSPDVAELRGQDLTLVPAPLTRWGMVVFIGGLPAWLAAGLVLDGGYPWPWPVLFGTLAVIITVRLLSVRIRCANGVVSVVHPAGRVRRIPAAAVTAVVEGDYPVIHWRDDRGDTRVTEAFGFWMGHLALRGVRRHHLRQLATLKAWVEVNRRADV